MTLNNDQQNTADKILKFILSKEDQFIIKGPAGVGKTYLMEYISKEVLSKYREYCSFLNKTPIHYDVEFTATTNKAASELSRATRRDCPTIHSFLGLKKKDNFKTGKTEFIKSVKTEFHRTLLFIDECSMIDEDLYNNIRTSLVGQSKIIYIGDHCQLPPVGYKTSPIYEMNLPSSELTELVRMAHKPSLINICNTLRETTIDLNFRKLNLDPGTIEYLSSEEELQQVIDKLFKTKEQGFDNRILCYTNNQVKNYNNYIRRLRGHPDTFVQGEILINNNPLKLGSEKLLKTDTLVRVDNINSKVITISDVEFYGIKINGYWDWIKVAVDQDKFDQALKVFAESQSWGTYFKWKELIPDFGMQECCTIHKSQGSTYDTVIIDLNDIGICNNSNEVARMLYVAASRAKNKIYFYGDLPDKYKE